MESAKPNDSDFEEHKEIGKNLKLALKCNPEILLTKVAMPFLYCKINGQTIKALVDSGADGCVMSQVRCSCIYLEYKLGLH